jgi:putative restriction endonuclease
MFAIAPTDRDWFERIRAGSIDRTVNFWTPTPWGVTGLHPGDRLYFMLKAPTRKIGGYGSFVRYVEATAAEAWQMYGLSNGVDSETELMEKITYFARRRPLKFSPSTNPVIGCIELADVITLDDGSFVTPEQCGHSFPRQVVKLKYFDVVDGIATRLRIGTLASTPFAIISGDPSRKPVTRKDRKGQPIFRQQILRNYGHQCCISGDEVEELLEAAHIQPYVDERSNHPQNGLCLRVDLHRLFDAGLITITDELKVRVSDRLSGTSYYQLSGTEIRLPSDRRLCPSAKAIAYRNSEEFRD